MTPLFAAKRAAAPRRASRAHALTQRGGRWLEAPSEEQLAFVARRLGLAPRSPALAIFQAAAGEWDPRFVSGAAGALFAGVAWLLLPARWRAERGRLSCALLGGALAACGAAAAWVVLARSGARLSRLSVQ